MKAFAVLILLASPAIAQPQCTGLAAALAALAENYGEAPRVTALMTGGNALIITEGPRGGWTALEISPDGNACIVAAGEALEVVDPEAAGTDS